MNSGLLKRLWPFLKWGMFIVVLVFVARHGHKLWTDVDRHPTRLNWGWLALATVASVVAWLPSAWYWRKLIVNLGFSPPWTQVLRSYYCGHLGKYMPGKAAAIVIRAALIRDSGVPTSAAALTVTAESVTYMGAGTLLAVLLYSSLAAHLPPGIAATAADARWRTGLVVLLLGGGLAGLALVVKSYDRLNNLFRNLAAEDAPTAPTGLSLRATVAGVMVFLAAWWIQGLTLGLTIQAVASEPVNWGNWPFWTGTATTGFKYKDTKFENGPVKVTQIKAKNGLFQIKIGVSAKIKPVVQKRFSLTLENVNKPELQLVVNEKKDASRRRARRVRMWLLSDVE
jgi:hypothetical protein